MNTSNVDGWLRDGCGRCEHYQTPACKVHRWTGPLVALRALVLESGLGEQLKWGSPCYTVDGRNVAMLVAFKERCALQFFKGALLEDPEGLLTKPGPNSQTVRFLEFRTVAEVKARRSAVRDFLKQAVALERAGAKVAKAPKQALPEELKERLAHDPALARAFAALTPGRQRSHVLHVGGAKQAETRARRVEQCAADILAGRGFNERSKR